MAKKKDISTNPIQTVRQQDIKPEPFYVKGSLNTVTSDHVEASMVTRSPMTREIYDEYRPDEKTEDWGDQESQQRLIKECVNAYRTTGIVRQVIDAMSEWIADGVTIKYSAEAGQNFMNEWSKLVNLPDRVERFANWVLKGGQAVVRRRYGTLKGVKIPVGYILYDPSFVYIAGDYLSGFSTNKRYSIRLLANDLAGKQYSPNQLTEKELKTLPPEILSALTGKQKQTKTSTYYVDIPSDAVYVSHYKKDDTDIWAVPFLYSALHEIKYNRKLHLAKTTMLDGVISPYRIWNIGNIEKDIMPTPTAMSTLHEILKKNVGGGAVDIVWDDMLKMSPHYPPIENMQHMTPNYDEIMWALGIYVYSDNMNDDATPLGIRTLVQRVKYVRELVIRWLETEIELIKTATGFRGGEFTIEFNYADFTTEESYRRMMVDLLDRNIISDRRILQLLGENAKVQEQTVRTEMAERDGVQRPYKAGPYHNDNDQYVGEEIAKRQEQRAIKNGLVGGPTTPQKKKPGGKQGRPPGAKDGTPRKRVKKSFASLTSESSRLYDTLYHETLQSYKAEINKSDVRAFTSDEKTALEQRFMSKFTSAVLDESHNPDSGKIIANYNDEIKNLGINSTADQRRELLISCFAEYWHENLSS